MSVPSSDRTMRVIRRGPSLIDTIQRREKCSLVSLARRSANSGESLKSLANRLGMPHGTLKAALRRRGYHHPTGCDLIDHRLVATTGVGLEATVRQMASRGLSRGRIAKDLCVDPATLQKLADRCGIVFPKTIVFRDTSKIVEAMKARIPDRRDLRRIEHNGKTLCLAEWARLTGIAASTIHYRLSRGWTVASALSRHQIRSAKTGRFRKHPPLDHTRGAAVLLFLKQGPATSLDISAELDIGLANSSALLSYLWQRGYVERSAQTKEASFRGRPFYLYSLATGRRRRRDAC